MKGKPVPPPPETPSPALQKVLLLDDHPVVREALAARIEREPDLTVCCAAGEAEEALRAAETHRPALAILDLSLGKSHGLEVIKALRLNQPGTKTVVFTMHDESLYGQRAFLAGARGYVMKHEPPEEIITAIRKVLAGKLAMSPRLEQIMLRNMTQGDESLLSVERLSNRELEVFQLLGMGLTTKEIAVRLQRRVKTIDTFRNRIKRKLEIQSTPELIAVAARWAVMR